MSVKGKQESKQARCPHCPQLLFSRSFKWQGCPVTSHSSFALVGAEGHHADPNPAALPLSSVAGDIFGFGHSLLPLLTLGTCACFSHCISHHLPPCSIFLLGIEGPLSTPCPAPLPLIPPKFLSKMRPLANTITLSLQEVNSLPWNKTIGEFLCLDFSFLDPGWGLQDPTENSCWVPEGSFRIWLPCSLLLATLEINATRDVTFPGLHLSKPFLQQPEKPPQGNFLCEPKSDGQLGRDKVGEDIGCCNHSL